ncbi:hypothetical protein F5Y09DRAFT_346130 [Xylaria sp. FL1042]|nr:hypothetical protein F5Y09DRAFT_346130 [Xylaria sp. FL1042]
MSVQEQRPLALDLPASSESSDSRVAISPSLLATTNYGAQIAYNYGSISNYFCSLSGSDETHECHFPDISPKNGSVGDLLYRRIKTAREFYSSKHWAKAKDLFYDVLGAPCATLDVVERSLLQYNLGHVHFALGDFYHVERYADAAEELRYFILTRDQQDDSGAEQVTAAQLWLGLTFERLDSHDIAKDQLSDVFEARTQSLGPEHLDTLACRHHLANFLYKRKAYLEAHEHFKALLLVEDNLSGPEKEEATRTRCMLAFCLAKVERYEEAEPHLQRALARMDPKSRFSLDETCDTGLVCFWFGRISLKKETRHSVDQAAHMFQRALTLISRYMQLRNEELGEPSIKNNHGGQGDEDNLQDELIGCRCYLAHTMRFQGQLIAAEQAYRQILDPADAVSQEYLVASRLGLADCLKLQKKPTEAKAVLEEVVSIGIALFRLRQFDSARSQFQLSMDTEKQLGSTRLLFESECWLSWSLCEVGSYEEAEIHLLPAFTQMPARKDSHSRGFEDFFLGFSHFYQGRIALHRRRNISEASRNLQLALGEISRFHGLDSPIYLECRYYLSYSLVMQNDYSQARQMFEELQRSQCSEEPLPDILFILVPFWLGQISRWRGSRKDAEHNYSKCLASLHGDSLPLHSSISAAQVRYYHAKSLFRLGRIDESARIAREILAELDRGDANNDQDNLRDTSRELLSWCLHKTENFKEACDHLMPAIEQSPQGTLFLSSKAILIDCLSEVGRHDEATPYLLRLETELDMVESSSRSVVNSIVSYWLGRRAFRNRKRGQGQPSQHFTDAQKWLVRLQGARWAHMRMECQHFHARCQLRDKKRVEAEGKFRGLALQQYESGNRAYAVDNQHWLGRSLIHQGMDTAAIPVLEKIITDKESGKLEVDAVALSHKYLGYCHFIQSRFEQAKLHYDQAPLEILDQESNAPNARFCLAKCNFNLGLYEVGAFGKARKQLLHVLEKYQELKQSNTENILLTRLFAARSLVGLGRNTHARTELERLVIEPWYQSRPSDETIMLAQYDLARIAYQIKDWAHALELFQAALLKHETVHGNKSTLDVEQCQRYLALALQAAGQAEEATKLYRKILDEQPDEIAKPPRHMLLDVQICLSRTLYCFDKRHGSECHEPPEPTEDDEEWPRTPTGPSHPYSVRRQILLADLSFHLSDFMRAEEVYTKLLTLMESSDEARRDTPVPIAYLRSALAVTLSKLERADEARALAATALEVDCPKAHHCRSLEGFDEAFPEFISSNLETSDSASKARSCASCKRLAKNATRHISSEINDPMHPKLAKTQRSSLTVPRASSAEIKQVEGSATPQSKTSRAASPGQPLGAKSSPPSPINLGSQTSVTTESGSSAEQSPEAQAKNQVSRLSIRDSLAPEQKDDNAGLCADDD